MRIVVAVLGWLVLLASVLLSIDRFVASDVKALAMAAAFATYAVVGYVVAFVLLLLVVRKAKRRTPVVAALVLCIVAVGFHAYLLAPFYYGDAAGEDTDLTVMSANLEFGQADANDVVRAATRADVDVLVLQEVTPDARRRLEESGLDELLPNVVGKPSTGVVGTMVFSSARLGEEQDLALGNGGLSVRVGSGKAAFTLLAVHTATPPGDTVRWKRDLATIREATVRARKDGPVMAVGDFNATTDHASFRDLLDAGLSDAPAQANSGWFGVHTWPTKYRRSLFRPLIAIDHVLTTPAWSARSVDTVDLPDTDHRGLVVRLDRV